MKKGDKVKIKKVVNSENESTDDCWWVDGTMDAYIGKILTLEDKGDTSYWGVVENNWSWSEEWMELVEDIIIYCETKEDYIKIVDKIGWYDGEKHYDYWGDYEKETCAYIEGGKIDTYSTKGYYQEHSDLKIITAKEYLGERELVWSLGSRGELIRIQKRTNKELNNITNQLNSNNMIKKMTMALKRILKGDLRKQYKAGLINEDTSLTEAGEEIRDDILGQDERVQKALTERANEIIKEAK